MLFPPARCYPNLWSVCEKYDSSFNVIFINRACFMAYCVLYAGWNLSPNRDWFSIYLFRINSRVTPNQIEDCLQLLLMLMTYTKHIAHGMCISLLSRSRQQQQKSCRIFIILEFPDIKCVELSKCGHIYLDCKTTKRVFEIYVRIFNNSNAGSHPFTFKFAFDSHPVRIWNAYVRCAGFVLCLLFYYLSSEYLASRAFDILIYSILIDFFWGINAIR